MIWTSTTKGDDKIIAYFNNTIYKGNPKDSDLKTVITELENQKSIPASFGVVKVVLIFGSFLLIALTGFILKTKNPKVIHTIKIIR